LRLVATGLLLVGGAFLIAPYAGDHIKVAIGIPAALVAAFFATRRPVAAVIGLVLASATLGSVQAFTGINLGPLINLLLLGLWIATLVRLATGRRGNRYLLWPSILACLLYVFVTAVEILTAPNPSLGFLSFRTSTWYILAFPLLAYAGWSRETYRRVAKGLVVVTVLVAGYAVLRWHTGPAGAERDFAQTHAILVEGQLRTVGSFITGHQLGLWAGLMAPFCLAFALGNRGRWRWAAGLGGTLCIFAIFATALRGPLIGMAAGVAVVLAVYGASSAFRARLLPVVASGVALLALGAIALGIASESSGIGQRYSRILHPSQDFAYAVRQAKWSDALDDIDRHPFGQGLGSAGFAQVQEGPYLNIASLNIDSVYLKIAYEQGLAVMVFFVAAFVLLLLRLGLGAIASTDREIAALAIGGAGSLAAMLVTFYSGTYTEAPPVVTGWLVLGLGLSGLVAVSAERTQPASEEAPPEQIARRIPAREPAAARI
jgi:hypothetical protein